MIQIQMFEENTEATRKHYPAFHYLYLLSLKGCGGLVPVSSGHWVRGGVHPGRVGSPSQTKNCSL